MEDSLKRIKGGMWLPPYWTGAPKTIDEARPYFGFIGRHTNGPGNRTKRMTDEFGNYCLNPNLIYAQSGWSIMQLQRVISRANSRNIPVVLNQNGWYYPAWYAGDWKLANKQLLWAHENAERVIFQSRFCVDAMSELTGVVSNASVVMHNAVPVPLSKPAARNPARPTLWLSGAFHKDADHILAPALKAVEILSQTAKEDAPLLKLAGHFDESAKRADWFYDVQRKIGKLVDVGVCEWVGKYSLAELPEKTKDVSIALHLTSKDSCPNAVLERMALGIGHVYADSGGTPELVGEAGVRVNSPVDWYKQTAVDADELVEAIEISLGRWIYLGNKSFERVERNFSWHQYVEAHKKLFLAITSGLDQVSN